MKKATAKRALLMSALSLLLCVSMLVGSTFAWFTDSVVSGNNIIKSGNLDVEMLWKEGKTDPASDDGWSNAADGAIFNYDLWEPGYTEVRHVKIENMGTLALKYQLTIVANGEASKLADVIDVYYMENATQVTERTELAESDRLGTLTEVLADFSSTASGVLLQQNEKHTVTIALKMQESAGNEYEELSIGSSFSVKLLATQFTYEKDSFDEYYDDIDFVMDLSQVKNLRGEDGDWMVLDDMNTEDILVVGNGVNVSLDLNGKTITAEKTNQYSFGVQNGGSMTLTGEGIANVGKGFMTNKGGATIIVDGGTYNMTATGTLNGIAHHSLAQNSSSIVINGGTFTSNVNNAVLFFATSNSQIEINGGFFENTVDSTPDLLGIGTNSGNTNRIILKGGTFVNYNPLEDRMCYKGAWPASYDQFSGPWILIWDGYTVVSETQANGDIWYTVVPA